MTLSLRLGKNDIIYEMRGLGWIWCQSDLQGDNVMNKEGCNFMFTDVQISQACAEALLFGHQ